jgi:hypothetical protein
MKVPSLITSYFEEWHMLDFIACLIFFGFCFIFVVAVIQTIAEYMREVKPTAVFRKTRLTLLRFFNCH